MKKTKKKIFSIITRYILLLILPLFNFYIFYIVLTPLTIYPVYILFSLFFDASLSGNIITLGKCFPIEIIGACVAGSAYYLLLILNLSIPDIKINKRLKMIFSSFAAFLILNILRIFFLGLLFMSNSISFFLVHLLFWYALSVVLVVLIWFLEVKFFKIKEIPFYSDIKFLYKKIR